MKEDEAYGISSPTPAGKKVIVFFANGTYKEFDECTDISEPADTPERQVLIFTHRGMKYTFKKSQLAGWAY